MAFCISLELFYFNFQLSILRFMVLCFNKILRYACRADMENEGLLSAFKMEDVTVMGAAELVPHMFRIWVCLLDSSICTILEH